jgi:hypothetical protein
MSPILDVFKFALDALIQCVFIGVMAAIGICIIAFGVACAVWAYRKIRYHW